MATKTDPLVHMGTITGGEARELLQSNPVILLPMGSHEDQGPHAPMGDYLLAEKIAELAALQASKAGTRTLVAPVLPYGGADWFGPMIGGIAISQSTLTAVIAEMVDSLHRNGLTRIIVINGHGGNVGPISEVARELYQRERIVLPSLYLWRIAYGMLPGIVGAETSAKVSGHGADPLTSLGLHLFPELIRKDLIPAGKPMKRDPILDLPFTGLGTASFDGAEVGVPHEYDEVYHDGVGKGDPTLCSAETGAKLAEKLSDVVARFVAHFAAKIPA
ncbi:creatininase [Bosea sp. Root670]|uniref:Creatinine amidohydrolase n=1 Tax=Bosea robiniae TaxID=1036780 RepID=A0ABY0P9P8_9HYPH|nr:MULTISPECIES: creatininase family protein [Bosea]KRE05078.1 creatininase [Bosea sp. Root670]TQI74354.1 creatinine amidohydrolase [Bosea sp. AK1]SDH77619.1 creatinine amidohydrolase [Bosea robiniae]